MNSILERAAIAAVVGVGMVAGVVPTVGADTVPDGTGYHRTLRWEHTRPDMVGNTSIEVLVLGPARVQQGWLDAGKTIPRGGIVMGYSEIFKYNLSIPGRPDYYCKVYLAFHPNLDTETYDHEMRHCDGWTHQEWTEALVTSQAEAQ